MKLELSNFVQRDTISSLAKGMTNTPKRGVVLLTWRFFVCATVELEKILWQPVKFRGWSQTSPGTTFFLTSAFDNGLDCRKSTFKRVIFTARGYAKRGIYRRRVSVCVSVTLRHCIKTAKRRITQTTPHDSSFLTPKFIAIFERDKCRLGGLKLVTFDEKRAITRKRYKIDI